MMDIRELSYQRVGDIWTEVDHIALISALDKIDRTVQEIFKKQKIVLATTNMLV